MPGRLSAWSVASLALLALAVLFFLTAVWYRETTHTSSPGSGAGLLVLLVLCFGAAWTCTLLGAITAWVGVRFGRGNDRYAHAAWAINSALCYLGLVLAALHFTM